MGMVGSFAALSPADYERLRGNPDGVQDYLFSEEGEVDPPFYFDVDKTWHAIHFMLAGSPDGVDAPPEAMAVLGGEEVGDEIGYGPARLLSPSQVAMVAKGLEPLTPEVFGRRYRPKEMDAADIYPQIWERDGAEGLEYILAYYQQLRTFYLDAAQRGDGAILWLS